MGEYLGFLMHGGHGLSSSQREMDIQFGHRIIKSRGFIKGMIPVFTSGTLPSKESPCATDGELGYLKIRWLQEL